MCWEMVAFRNGHLILLLLCSVLVCREAAASVSVTRETALKACASKHFAERLAASSPFETLDACIAAARRIWWQELPVQGWLDALTAHPGISSTSTDAQLSKEVVAASQAYKDKFGFNVITSTNATSAQLLPALKQRMANTPYTELGVAAAQQMQLTEQRLRQLLGPQTGASSSRASATATAKAAAGAGRSPITTHVLDTSLGTPATGVPISLLKQIEGAPGVWEQLAAGTTDMDGRISNLLPPASSVSPGTYQMRFETGAYMRTCREQHPGVFSAVPFYPRAVVEWTITQDTSSQHFHIPLVLNPYSYSTYRGS